MSGAEPLLKPRRPSLLTLDILGSTAREVIPRHAKREAKSQTPCDLCRGVRESSRSLFARVRFKRFEILQANANPLVIAVLAEQSLTVLAWFNAGYYAASGVREGRLIKRVNDRLNGLGDFRLARFRRGRLGFLLNLSNRRQAFLCACKCTTKFLQCLTVTRESCSIDLFIDCGDAACDRLQAFKASIFEDLSRFAGCSFQIGKDLASFSAGFKSMT